MTNSDVKRFGILTSGGDAPGLNAAIRAVVKTAVLEYGMEAIGIRNGYRGLIAGDMFPLSSENMSGLLTVGGTILGTARSKPFKNPQPDPITGLYPIESIKKNYREWNLDALVVLGGNGTNSTASQLYKEGINVIGLPKTIDNDIMGTDMTFGFHTAVDVATDAIDRIHSTAHSHSRIMVIEVMGHKAGWLGLYSGIAGGADVILIPEIPYDINVISDTLIKRKNEGKNFSIVVVAEGAKSKEEALLDKGQLKKLRAHMTNSIGYKIAKDLEKASGLESRVTVLGYLQRGGTPSPYDRILATQFGNMAARFLAEKKFGTLIALKGTELVGIPLNEVEGKTKKVPLDLDLLKTAEQMGICFGSIKSEV